MNMIGWEHHTTLCQKWLSFVAAYCAVFLYQAICWVYVNPLSGCSELSQTPLTPPLNPHITLSFMLIRCGWCCRPVSSQLFPSFSMTLIAPPGSVFFLSPSAFSNIRLACRQISRGWWRWMLPQCPGLQNTSQAAVGSISGATWRQHPLISHVFLLNVVPP